MRIDGIQLGLEYPVPGAEAAVALAGASIRLPAAGIHAVTGPSGCGKSSLLYVLAGLRKPTEGTVYYDDVDIQSITFGDHAKLRRNKFGFIFQRHFLLDSLTVLDNVLVPLHTNDRAGRRLAAGLLARLDLHQLSDRKPHMLSQGQRQRVAVARALVNRPEVIFADEPTAALDRESTDAVISLLIETGRQASILLITHDPAVLEHADKMFYMKGGRIIPRRDNSNIHP